jgi:UDP:flavonoid glycosyltransferase YjiC (YdhE family)
MRHERALDHKATERQGRCAKAANRYGPLPANVLLAPYLPQARLPGCPAARRSCRRAGRASCSALAHGLPQLVLPQGGDQFSDAAAFVSSGVGLALGPAEVSAAAVASGVTDLLRMSSFRTAAVAVRRELIGIPDAAAVLAELTAPWPDLTIRDGREDLRRA